MYGISWPVSGPRCTVLQGTGGSLTANAGFGCDQGLYLRKASIRERPSLEKGLLSLVVARHSPAGKGRWLFFHNSLNTCVFFFFGRILRVCPIFGLAMPLFPLVPLFFLVQNSFFILLCLKIMPNAMPCTSLYMGLALIAKGIAIFLLLWKEKQKRT